MSRRPLAYSTSIVRCSHGYSRSKSAAEDSDKFDVGTKSAILEASSSVACLISRTGDKVVFIGSGTIIGCEAHDESFLGTILTSATFVQGPTGEASIPHNLEIDVYLSDGKLYKGQVLAYDFHHNIATITINSDAVLPIAKIRCVDDNLAIDSNTSVLANANLLLHGDEETGSTQYHLFPDEFIIALARYCQSPHEIMAAPGFISCDDSPLDCKDLFLTTCFPNKAAVGGPVINVYGEVIGVSFIVCPCNAFLPINLALKCLEDLKNNRQVPRPWLGVGVASLYTAKLEKLDELTRKFPDVTRGAIIEQINNMRSRAYMKELKVNDKRIRAYFERKRVRRWTFRPVKKWLKARVILESIKTKKRIQKRERKMKTKEKCPASCAGLFCDDIIVGCDGNPVGSPLELAEALWDKEGKTVELIVIRPRIGQLKLAVKVGTSPKMNRWHIPHTGLSPIFEHSLAIERKDNRRQ